MAKNIIEFYFDPISPYAWLASTQLSILETNVESQVIARPILFAGLLKAHGTKGPAEIEAKRNYTFRDVMRLADSFEIPFKGPPAHPFNPLLALRSCIAIDDDQSRLRLACSLMKEAWELGGDISDPSTVSRVVESCDLDVAEIEGLVVQNHIKKKLVSATEDAIGKGIFGVPTFCTNGEIFWGVDRIDLLQRYLAGNGIDEDVLGSVLGRAASALRKV